MTDQPAPLGSLFSGYGGLDEALEDVFGAKVAWLCEYDDAPSKILAHAYPDVPNFGDVTKIDWDVITKPEVMSGGYPCQPFSGAGARKGTDDPRHLFPHFAKGISALRPKVVVAENVRGHLTLGFDVVMAEWVRLGYDVQWMLIRASDVGAPHGRARVFFLATDPGQVPALPASGAPVTELVNGVWSTVGESMFGRHAWAGKFPSAGRLVGATIYDNTAVLGDVAAAIRAALGSVTNKVVYDTNLQVVSTGADSVAGLGGVGGLLPSPTAALGAGGQTSRSGARKDELLLAGVAQAVSAGELLPTPRATRGGSGTETMYRLGAERTDEDRPQGQVLLPTPTASLAIGSTPTVERSRERAAERGLKLDESVNVLVDDVARRVSAAANANGRVTAVVEPLLKTPTAQLAVNDGSQHPDKRKAGGHGPTLADEVEHLLPSPRAMDFKASLSAPGARRHVDKGFGSLTEVVGARLLPTPRASDGEKGGPNQHGSSGDLMLPSAVHHLTDEATVLLPTPVVNDMGKAYTPEQWDAWREKLKAEHGNGNGHGPSLEIEAARFAAGDLEPGDTAPAQQDAAGQDDGLFAVDEVAPVAPAPVGPVLAGYEQWGQYGPAIARWERVLGRPAPSPTSEVKKGGAQRLSPVFVEWMMGQPAGRITDPAIGITRNEQLKACGNGVVTLQASVALRLMLATR